MKTNNLTNIKTLTEIERDIVLKKYMQLKAAAADINGELSLLREEILSTCPTGEYNGIVVLIDERTTETFGWKDAKAKLPPETLNELLPFVKKTKAKVLNVKSAKGDAE